MTSVVDGPVGGIIAISNGLGEVRGYVGNPKLGEIELSEAVGLGTVQVVKNHPDWPRPYNGITAVRYGDIDRDVGKLKLGDNMCHDMPLEILTKLNYRGLFGRE